MSHEYRILSNMLIREEISPQEFIERIDTIKQDTHMSLADKFMKGEIGEIEFVEWYNRLIAKESEEHYEPILTHEHI